MFERNLFLRMAEGEGGGAAAAGDAAAANAGGKGDSGGAGAAADAGKVEKVVTALKDLLPEDMRGDKRFDKYADVGALAKGWAELDTWRGKAVVPPGKDASPEEWGKFYDRLGRPKTARDYKIELGEGMQVSDQAAFDRYLDEFYAAGLTPAQAQRIATYEVGRMKTAAEARATKIAEDLKALDTEWGDKKAGNVEIAKRAAATLGLTKGDIDAIGAKSGNATLIRALHKIGLGIAEDKAVGSAARDPGGETPDAIQKEIDTLQASKEYRLGDKTAHDKVRGLYQKLYPPKAA